MDNDKYVHGYSEREAERLEDQSSILEELLHGGTAYPPGSKVLEAGCGVGAQTVFLSRRSPHAQFTSIDISTESLQKAAAHVASSGVSNVQFQQANIYALPFAEESFDHVFVCFVLEHLEKPLQALLELKRALKTGGTITAIEGDHGSCFWHPETSESRVVWECLIHVQANLGDNSLIGRQLYQLLRDAGFDVQDVSPRFAYADARSPEQLNGGVNKILVPMVETARERALQLGLTDEATWNKGIADYSRVGTSPDGTVFYTWFKGVAVK